ncbi:MAG: hypothetical protein FH753_15975 [Firmicutes bacterium]|nr:hypothetical protein [Bacillota bacterium]
MDISDEFKHKVDIVQTKYNIRFIEVINMAQNIEVVVNIPDEEYAKKAVSKAIADIIENRINQLPEELRLKAYKDLIDEFKVT